MDNHSTINQDVKQLGRQVEECMEKVDRGNDLSTETKKDVEKILEVLTGNEIDEEDLGLIGDFRKLKERVYKLERKYDRMIYLVIGFSVGAGYAISDIIRKIFTR